MENPENLKINLKRRMDEKGWSLKRFALEARVSYHTVFRAVSHGRVPRGGNLAKMAGALGCTIAELYLDPSVPPEVKVTGHWVGQEALLETMRLLQESSIREIERISKENTELKAKAEKFESLIQAWKGAGDQTRAAVYFLLTGAAADLEKVRSSIRSQVRMMRKALSQNQGPAAFGKGR